MDRYEAIFKDKVRDLVSSLHLDLYEVAQERVQYFAARIYQLISENNEPFDLIIGAGSTGIAAASMAKMVYKEADQKLPFILIIPTYRFTRDNKTFDNHHLLPFVKEIIQGKPKFKNILFVDDEIRRGQMAKACIDLLMEAGFIELPLTCTIVAENHFFEWHYNLPQVSVKFFSHAKVLPGINYILSYLVQNDLYEKITSALGQDPHMNRKKIMTILLEGICKSRSEEGKAFINYSDEEKLKKNLPEYLQIKTQFIDQIDKLITSGIKRFKSREITFSP